MNSLDSWMVERGDALVSVLQEHRSTICAVCTDRLASTFPHLCYDGSRPDAAAFQHTTFRETPRRLHTLVLAVLRFHTLSLVEPELNWLTPILARHGVTGHEMVANVQFYFAAVRQVAQISSRDQQGLAALEAALIDHVRRAAT